MWGSEVLVSWAALNLRLTRRWPRIIPRPFAGTSVNKARHRVFSQKNRFPSPAFSSLGFWPWQGSVAIAVIPMVVMVAVNHRSVTVCWLSGEKPLWFPAFSRIKQTLCPAWGTWTPVFLVGGAEQWLGAVGLPGPPISRGCHQQVQLHGTSCPMAFLTSTPIEQLFVRQIFFGWDIMCDTSHSVQTGTFHRYPKSVSKNNCSNAALSMWAGEGYSTAEYLIKLESFRRLSSSYMILFCSSM